MITPILLSLMLNTTPLNNVFPLVLFDNFSDGNPADSIVLSKGTHAFAFCVSMPNVSNALLGNFCMARSFSSTVAPLSNSVPHVVCGAPDKKMLRVDAFAIVTNMANEFSATQRTMHEFEHNTMGWFRTTAASRDGAVSAIGRSNPFDAVGFGVLSNLFQKPTDQWSIELPFSPTLLAAKPTSAFTKIGWFEIASKWILAAFASKVDFSHFESPMGSAWLGQDGRLHCLRARFYFRGGP